MNRKPSLGVRFLLATISFVLSFCLFFTAMGAMFVLNARSFTDKDTLQNTITKIAQDNTEVLVEFVYSFLEEQLGEDSPVSVEQVEAFLAESTITDFLSEKIAAVVSSVYNGDNAPVITEEEVAEQLQENAALIEKHFEVTISEENIQEITNMVKESGVLDMLNPENILALLNQSESQIPGNDNISDDILGDFAQSGGSSSSEAAASDIPTGFDSLEAIVNSVIGGEMPGIPLLLEAARFLTSDTILFGAIGISILLIALLIVVNIKQIHLGLIKSGIPVLIAGGLMLLPVALSSVISQTVDKTIGNLLLAFISATIPIGATAAGIGLALIIGGIVVYSVRRSMARNTMLAAANETPVIILSDNDNT